jgi:hypothetical protein
VVAIAVLMGAVILLVAPAQAFTPIALSIPGHYIANYKQRAKKCSDLSAFPWVNWLTYQGGAVSGEWVVAASSKPLCDTARKTSRAVIRKAPDGDGASYSNLSDMINYAHRTKPFQLLAPKPAGASWKCAVLPSFWGETARTVGDGAVDDQALAGAAGAAAGAGYCEKGATRNKGVYKGGEFFSWTPDTVTCKLRYRLKEVPDPNFPGSTKPISGFPAQLWGDYDQVPC